MKKITVFYWLCTGLIIIALGIGSVKGLVSDSAVESVTALGYPAYLVPFLSVARLLAIAVLLLPLNKYRTLREWAYAGITFDLLGAIYSHIASGRPLAHLIGIVVPLILLTAAYLLYHKKIALIELK